LGIFKPPGPASRNRLRIPVNMRVEANTRATRTSKSRDVIREASSFMCCVVVWKTAPLAAMLLNENMILFYNLPDPKTLRDRIEYDPRARSERGKQQCMSGRT
jgi:hypothetical protein